MFEEWKQNFLNRNPEPESDESESVFESVTVSEPEPKPVFLPLPPRPAVNSLSMRFTALENPVTAYRAGPNTVTKTKATVNPYRKALKKFLNDNNKLEKDLTEEDKQIVRQMVKDKQHADFKKKIWGIN